MKLFSFLALAAASAFAAAPQLQQVNRVYILAMSSGMDQFLANQLTKYHVFEVVTDPQKADAILTDRVGEPFENKLNDLYPPPKSPEQLKKEAEKKQDDDAKPGTARDRLADVDLSAGAVSRVSTLGRGRGNFFIVDRGSRAVLWSIYQRPKDSTPGELERTAEKVVKQLKSDLTEKKPTE